MNNKRARQSALDTYRFIFERESDLGNYNSDLWKWAFNKLRYYEMNCDRAMSYSSIDIVSVFNKQNPL